LALHAAEHALVFSACDAFVDVWTGLFIHEPVFRAGSDIRKRSGVFVFSIDATITDRSRITTAARAHRFRMPLLIIVSSELL
jgi:hypothetical protein